MRSLQRWNLRLFDKNLIHSEVKEEREEKHDSLTSLNLPVKWFFIFLLFPFLLAACGHREEVFRQESFVFGTRVEISIAGTDKSRAAAATQAVLARFDALHRKLHAWQPSPLSALNAAFAQGKKLPVDAELGSILQSARTDSIQSAELFNPAIGKLIGLWGFHTDLPQAQQPAPSAIAALVKDAPSMRDVHIENGLAWSDNPAVQIDLGGYAKGYALDEAAAILKRQGVRNALVNIGGNVLALGQNTSDKQHPRAWKVGIQHPRQSGVIATLELRDGEAIGTSGDYQRYFESGGQRYCHLIDPRTGQPANAMQSVTIVTAGQQAGVKSDVLTKPLFIAGVTQLRPLSNQLGVPLVLAVAADGSVLVSPAMLQRLQWTDPKQAYRLVR